MSSWPKIQRERRPCYEFPRTAVVLCQERPTFLPARLRQAPGSHACKDRPLSFGVPQTRRGKQRASERQYIITAFPELTVRDQHTPTATMSSTGTFRGTPKNRPQSVYSESPSVANSNIPRPKLETVQSEASTSHSAVRAKQSKRDEVWLKG